MWTDESGEVQNFTNLSSAPTHCTHKPHSVTLKMERVHSSETSEHIPTTQHRNPKDKHQMFSCFHIFTRVQAQYVHNTAASCSTFTAMYHCNKHTIFQKQQLHKQFTIQNVRTDLLDFPCRHSNKLLSFKSFYSTILTTSQQHTSQMAQAHFPFPLPQGTASFVHSFLYGMLRVNAIC